MTTALRTNHIQDEYERPVPGASIYVYNADNSLAALTSDGTTVIANPLTSDAFGNYSYYAVVAFYREDVWFGGKLRWSENNVAVGSPGADLTLRSDLTKWGLLTVTPQQFGAVADGVTDDYPAFAAALAYLAAFALNNGSIYYNGSPRLFVPAGKYRSSAAIDVTHTVIIEGDGSGQFGPGSFGCSHIKFDAATDGIRFQAANTSGNTTIDNPIHNGSGGAVIRDLCLEGGFNGTTESDHHGLVIRNAIKAERLYIKNFPGEGVKAWAGNVTGQPSVSGNVSSTMLVSVKTEGCRGGIDIRGSDANVVTTINCEGYQNRWFGILDDNGAGSNTHIGVHCASNGVVFGTWAQTQCSNSGNYYALVWGGDPTVAPSGTTADTANWFYIAAGSPIANLIPAWVNTANTFRAGGDYLTLNSAGVLIDNCYSETGGFNQFSANTIINHGSITDAYYRGGTRLNPNNGYRISQSPDVNLTLQHSSTQGAILVEDAAGVTHSYILLTKTSGNFYKAREISGHVFQTAPYNGSSTNIATIDPNGLRVISGSLGYGAGVGGTITQATNKSTGVTLNKVSGQVTMNAAALASAAKVSFVVTNSTVAATDFVGVNVASGGTANAYRAAVTAVAAGSFTTTVENITAGSLSEAPVISFAVIKAVAA